MKKTAFLYDFDKTLCTKDMQEYSLIPELGYENASDFWAEVSVLSKSQKMDPISTYLYYLKEKFAEQSNPLKKDHFIDLGKSIELYPGVEEWFERINEYGKQLGLEIEHYVISSGMKEIIEGSSIAKHFKEIYACRYYYDEQGYAKWPAQIINYTTKTQYIFRVNKQALDESDNNTLNEYVPNEDRPIPFTRMVYIADGITDVPCLKLIKEYGGKSVVVYNAQSAKAGIIADHLIQQGRANHMAVADYREGSDMDNLAKLILNQIAVTEQLNDLEGTR